MWDLIAEQPMGEPYCFCAGLLGFMKMDRISFFCLCPTLQFTHHSSSSTLGQRGIISEDACWSSVLIQPILTNCHTLVLEIIYMVKATVMHKYSCISCCGKQ